MKLFNLLKTEDIPVHCLQHGLPAPARNGSAVVANVLSLSVCIAAAYCRQNVVEIS